MSETKGKKKSTHPWRTFQYGEPKKRFQDYPQPTAFPKGLTKKNRAQ